MKRFALPIAVLASILAQITFAGSERFSGKEMKQVAPAPAPECTWTGLYVGLHVGYGVGYSLWKDVDGGDDEDIPAGSQWHDGVFGGGQLGYNYEIGHFVLGVEGDFAYSDVGGERTLGRAGDDVNTITTNNNWTGTIAGRLGYAFDNNHLLAYAKGGVAIGHWEYDFQHHEPGGFTDSFVTDYTRTRGMVGFGLEYMFNCRWSAKLEGRYIFLGADNVQSTLVEGGEANEPNEKYQVELKQASIQVGVNYKIW